MDGLQLVASITFTAVVALIPAVSRCHILLPFRRCELLHYYTMMNTLSSLFFEPRAVTVETLRRGEDDTFWVRDFLPPF
ncbi:hypothetical protein F5J12DRAFT_277117 [Pisolithus orientalis]|uniref:uncharacterized protein n=1 Tax=Pisolithus orientalis TaxID=936130 RepID=UPI0022240DF8|nr:uncharacterized protein F5J12DRAFT_277117 [Pisolithus orientalis]KAI5999387.1 hypothetical protein F5J12DRAFT_277117 [Pisolithus orientalis]